METSLEQSMDVGYLIRAADGPTAVARALGLRQSAVSNWINRGKVPLEHLAAVSALAGVEPEQVRPDVEWERDADGRVVSYRVPVSMVATVDPDPSTVEPANAGAVEG